MFDNEQVFACRPQGAEKHKWKRFYNFCELYNQHFQLKVSSGIHQGYSQELCKTYYLVAPQFYTAFPCIDLPY